ncbi:MAG: cytochrome P450 [Myxococcota bacterium]
MSLAGAYHDVQASILSDPGEFADYHFLAIADPDDFRTALAGDLAARVTSEQRRRDDAPEVIVGLGFTSAGLDRLGVAETTRREMQEPYFDGMGERGDVLGDGGPSEPVQWEAPFGTGAVDAAIWLWGPDADALAAAWSELCAGGDAPPGTVRLATSHGQARWDPKRRWRIEPFGFRDGIGQPALRTGEAGEDPQDPERLAPGEFVLGLPSEADGDLDVPIPPPDADSAAAEARRIERHGSYMVFRKIEQFPRAFRRFVRDHSVGGRDRKQLKTEMVGRWKNGAVYRGESRAPRPSVEDEFRYDDACVRVPRGAHIRRANPRSDLDARLLKRHRILRRALPYRDGDQEGLLFVCFNARIDDQFELIQSQWLNGGNFSGFPSDRIDAIASSSVGTRRVMRSDGKYIDFEEPLSRVRGGEYLLVPGLEALRFLAAGGFRPADPVAPEERDLFDPSYEFAARTLAGPPLSRPIEGSAEKVWFVGVHADVETVLADGATFTIDPYRQRILHATGERLMISTSDHVPAEAPTRRERIELLQEVFEPADVPRIAAIVQGVLARLGPGLHEVVEAIGRDVPLAVAEDYLGVANRTGEPSPVEIAAHFGRVPPSEVPEAWVAQRKRELGSDPVAVGRHNLKFWTRMLFLETFGNLDELTESRAFAKEAASEFLEHLAERVADPTPDTVVARAAGLDPALAKLLAFELAVGGTDTVTLATAFLLDLLLTRPDVLAGARAAVRADADDDTLDRLIVECMRLAPPAKLLLRRCGPAGATIGGVTIGPGERVAALVAAACMDRRVFGRDPSAFDPTRDPSLAPVFGTGPHTCRGSWLALVQLREVLRWLLGPAAAAGPERFPGLRRAAGPKGRLQKRRRVPHALHLWLE